MCHPLFWSFCLGAFAGLGLFVVFGRPFGGFGWFGLSQF